jgi:hypothetical protein
MTTTTTPAGLIRFERSMSTKHAGKCFFCSAPTVPGRDFAALDGKWIAVCTVHAHSVVEQCKALIKLIQADAVTFGLTADDLAKVNEHAPANVADVLAGNTDLPTSIAAAIKLSDALRAVRAHKPAGAATVRTNSYDGKCAACKADVLAGTGRIERKPNGERGWLTYHLDGQCPAPATAAPVKVAEGRYALRSDAGDVRFYRVEHGAVGSRWEGFVFVSAQASDELHPIRNRNSRTAILDAIAADPQAATILYGKELGVCGRCGATLTSEWRKQGIGPTCSTKAW